MYGVLLVDDREIFRLEIKRLNVWGEASGFEIIGEAGDGWKALEMLQAGSYDLVITDIRMPRMDGIELLQAIKAGTLCPCVAFLSEYSEFEYARQGLLLGAMDYIIKPAGATAVLDLLEKAKKQLDQLKSAEEEKGLYPRLEERRLIQAVKEKDEQALAICTEMIGKLSGLFKGDAAKTELVMNQVLANLTDQTALNFPWLGLFINLTDFQMADGEINQDFMSYKAQYLSKLERLVQLIRKLEPPLHDGTLLNVCHHILSHVESGLSLKMVADHLYLNHTYLSNMFKQKTGLHFNNYVSMVKMERARFLLENSTEKSYEICLRLGYQDTEYFSKLFKKYTGVNPTELKRSRNTKNIRL